MSFRILVGIYRHNIPNHTPQTGYHGVTEVAKTANIPKMAKKCINCISALNRKKTKRFMIFDSPKKRGSFFRHSGPPPLHTSLKSSKKKWVSSEGGLGGSGPKTHWGMHLLHKIMILQGVKLTIQPLEVGYANSPK